MHLIVKINCSYLSNKTLLSEWLFKVTIDPVNHRGLYHVYRYIVMWTKPLILRFVSTILYKLLSHKHSAINNSWITCNAKQLVLWYMKGRKNNVNFIFSVLQTPSIPCLFVTVGQVSGDPCLRLKGLKIVITRNSVWPEVPAW